MTPKEKAIELVEKYKDYVHGFVGSSMLTNTEYPEQVLSQAKKAATIVADEFLTYDLRAKCESQFVIERRVDEYWEQVKEEIALL